MLDGKKCWQIWPDVREVALDDFPKIGNREIKTRHAARQKEIDFSIFSGLIKRVCPDLAAAYLVPLIYDPSKERFWVGFYDDSTDVISSAYSGCFGGQIMETQLHELFHAIQARMDDEEREKLYNYVWRTVETVAITVDDYYDSCSEQSARLFEHFASMIDNGGHFQLRQFADDPPDINYPVNLLADIYDGSWSRRRLAAQAARLEAVRIAEEKAKRAARRKQILCEFFHV